MLPSTTLPYLDLKGGGPTSSLLSSYESDLPGKTSLLLRRETIPSTWNPKKTSVFQLPNKKCYVSPGFSRWLLIMSQLRVRCWWWNSDGWRWGGELTWSILDEFHKIALLQHTGFSGTCNMNFSLGPNLEDVAAVYISIYCIHIQNIYIYIYISKDLHLPCARNVQYICIYI